MTVETVLEKAALAMGEAVGWGPDADEISVLISELEMCGSAQWYKDRWTVEIAPFAKGNDDALFARQVARIVRDNGEQSAPFGLRTSARIGFKVHANWIVGINDIVVTVFL